MSEEYENEVISEETKKTAEVKDETVCACPVCGKNIIERRFKDGSVMGYFCEDRNCFAMWKNNYFLERHHIALDRGTAIALMSSRMIKLPDIYFEKKGESYPGTLILDIEGNKCRYRFSF